MCFGKARETGEEILKLSIVNKWKRLDFPWSINVYSHFRMSENHQLMLLTIHVLLPLQTLRTEIEIHSLRRYQTGFDELQLYCRIQKPWILEVLPVSLGALAKLRHFDCVTPCTIRVIFLICLHLFIEGIRHISHAGYINK